MNNDPNIQKIILNTKTHIANKKFSLIIYLIRKELDNFDILNKADLQETSSNIKQQLEKCQLIINNIIDNNDKYKLQYVLDNLREEFNQILNICTNGYPLSYKN